MADDDAGQEEPVEETGPSLLQKMERFDRWHGAATRPRTVSTDLEGDDPEELPAILPDGWTTSKRRRRKPKRRRIPWRVRISVVLTVGVIGAGVAAALIFVPKFAEWRADEVVTDYRDALLALESELDTIDDSVVAITDPSLDGLELTTRIAPFGRFQAASLTLSDTVRDPLPDLPPLVPDEPIQQLAPTRQRLSLVAGRSDAISARLNKVIDYRIEYERLFVLPPLPIRVEASDANVLSLSLAGMLADSLDAITNLPADPFLDTHREAITATFEFFQQWEIDYLDALRRGSTARASAMSNQAENAILSLDAGLDAPLLQLRVWARDELDGLGRDVSAALILVSG